MFDLSQHCILAIDDEPDNLQVFKETLELVYDSVVRVAQSCDEALTILDTFHPTIIVTDLSMPKADGYVLLHRLRQRPDTAALPIVALTAHAMLGDRERILAAGFDGYISKPFNIGTLKDDLRVCVEKVASRQVKNTNGSNGNSPGASISPGSSDLSKETI